jgi:hypothetical protein
MPEGTVIVETPSYLGRGAAGFLAALLLPAGLAFLVVLITPEGGAGFSRESVRGGSYLIFCLGALSVLGSRRAASMPWVELAAVASTWIWAFILMGSEAGASSIVLVNFLGYGILSLVRVLGLFGLGSAGVLLWSAAALGSLFLVPAQGGSMSEHFVDLNPLAQIHMAIFSEDWIHGPVLYPRVGGHYFRTPDLEPFLVRSGGAAVLFLAFAAMAFGLRARVVGRRGSQVRDP